MVDTLDLFRRLSAGANFDPKRELVGFRAAPGPRRGSGGMAWRGTQHPLTCTVAVTPAAVASSALDFFGDGGRDGGKTVVARPDHEKTRERPKKAVEEKEEEEETLSSVVAAGGRKRPRRRSGDGGEGKPQLRARSKRSRKVRIEESSSSDVESEDNGASVGEGDYGEEGEGEGEEREEQWGPEEEGRIQLLAGQSPISSMKRVKAKKRKKKKGRKEDSEMITHMEQVNAFRKTHRIHVSGSDVPDAVESFEQLCSCYSLPSYVLKNMERAGYGLPTPIQMQAIPLMLQGREVLACAPTGSGKTAAFIVPILTHLKEPKRSGFRAVVVSPTRELAQQTYREFVRLSAGSGLRVHVLTKAKANTNTFGPKTSLRFDILVTTPNRLVHMLSQEPPAIHLHNVEWLVLDEADKLFEDGKMGFRDQVSQIYLACDLPDVKRALFSATLANGIEEFSHTHLDSPVRVVIGLQNSATDTVKQELLFVGQESGKLLAIRDIIQKGFTPPMLVFVQSKERAKDLFHELIYDGLNVDVIHSERTQAQRDNVVKSFRAGKIWVLICTDLMGRGIDFKGVNLVVNYDFPPSAVSYIHRIGRTGRAGRRGQAVSLFTEDDSVNLRSIANVMQASGCEVPEWMMKLEKPSKNMRKKLSKKPLERETIKTASRYDLAKAKRKRDVITASKKRKERKKGPKDTSVAHTIRT